jgi:ATP-dependent helicase/nuclease subunit A
MSVPLDVLKVQRDASDPAVSAWVAANAGSGKTHVLAQRVIRLLLAGTRPEKVLCLTYTKAAAANMANRVFDTLGRWTALDDDALDDAIAAIEGRRPGATQRVHARRLFAQALDTPGGLKVQTIHAFCTRLLRQFPFEADVAARFEVLEDRAQSELIDRQRLAVLLEAAAKPDGDLGRALTGAITVAADVTFAQLVGEAIARRDPLTKWIAAKGCVAAAIADLSRALGVDPNDSAEQVDREIVEGPLFPMTEWAAVAALCKASSASDQRQCERLSAAAKATGRERVTAYLSVFLTTDKFEARKSIITGALARHQPELAQRLVHEQARVSGLLDRRRAIEARDRSAALITIAAAVIGRIRAEKDRRGLLDYDDLIDKTLHLLDKVEAAWVHHKLDLGIDHVLIDEAQDTSPKQWEIVARLVAEFAAGLGARDVRRSIFAVGDEKQSIFSFQGAAPQKFAEMHARFEREFLAADLGWRYVRFLQSFRSTPVVLEAVDTVFGRPEALRGLTADAVAPVHEAIRARTPGLVEIWPLLEPDKKPEIEGWDAPFDTTRETTPRVRLARKIAASIKTWIARGERVGEGVERHAVRPGDILVLVRQRGALFEAIIRALKDADIAVAGADRLVLTEHIAVMDLMVLADALLLPDDDLALATVLKSPLFGLDDEQLFRIAWERRGSLRAALRAKANDLFFAEAAEKLDRYAEWARHDTPFAFYARILGAERGRARFHARLGAEAADALDEFLEHALLYERREAPTLQGFVAWLRAGSTEVKRDMDIARNEVRVMTVHGAKGLEGPVVILADTTTPPKGPREPRLLTLPAGGAPDTPGRLVWAGRKADDIAPVAAARAAAVRDAEDEYRRLLYVAMTRAADRLIVAGARGVNAEPEGCWYRLAHDALAADSVEEPADDGDGVVLRWRKSAPEDVAHAEPATAESPPEASLPDWLTRPAPAVPKAVGTITPSAAAGGVQPVGDRKAMARGRIVHRLLQALPAIAPERRAEAARRYLARDEKDFSDAERTRMAGEVLAVLDDPRFGPLFAPGSRAEVPIVGRVSGGIVSGQVDRLAVTESAVLIADYKTDRPAPPRPGDIPEKYVRQLALYRAVLAALYPGREVRAALVWTEGPALMDVPAATLDAALSRVAGAA